MSMLGTRVARKEDPALLTVGGKYVGDIDSAGALHATFVRSVIAHAEVTSIDTSEAETMDGVVGVFTAADLELEAIPPAMPMLNQQMLRSSLATDRVRHVGEPVAVVVSTTASAGVDAAELVIVDYEPLEAVISIRDAVTDRVLVHPDAGTNAVFGFPAADADGFFDDCEVTVDLSFRNQRMAICPLEPRAVLSSWAADDTGEPRLTQWSSTQFPHNTRDGLAGLLGVEPDRVRVITPDVGGGFGAKNGMYPEDVVVAQLAKRLGRPVRWAETRSENMLGMVHGRGCEFEATLGGTRAGDITHYRLKVLQDGGAYPSVGSVLPMFMNIMSTGVYDIPNVEVSATSVATNTTPMGAYRGAGRPEATAAIERMVDVLAAELELDPTELRRRNFIPADGFPVTTPTGADMDTGEYEKALDAVLAAADHAGLRAEQERRRQDPSAPWLGLGWCSYVEITNPVNTAEFGSMELRPDGSALLLTGASSHGQGHHTAFAQLASELTGIPVDRIEVRHGDTDEVPRGDGTGGSRSLQVGGTAIWNATEQVIEAAKEIAATLLEANPADIVLDTASGAFSVAGTPAVATNWSDVATHVASQQTVLRAESDFQPAAPTFPFGVHLSVVEVDRETGSVSVLRHISCDDAGIIVNPMIVDGQVHGGVAAGIGQALMEEFVYDEDGNPQTGNFMDYGFMSAAELPSFERIEQETRTDRNPLGVKGIGEAGTIGATPAVQNAVVDALAHLGVRHVDIPVTPQRVWHAITEATAG